MRRPRTAIAAAAVVALVIAGCGVSTAEKSSATKFTGEARAVATTIEDFQTAGDKRKNDEICDHLLSKAMVNEITAYSKKSCSDAMDKVLQDVDSFELEVVPGKVTVRDLTASAQVKSKLGDESNLSTINLVKEGGRWKINSLGGAPPAK